MLQETHAYFNNSWTVIQVFFSTVSTENYYGYYSSEETFRDIVIKDDPYAYKAYPVSDTDVFNTVRLTKNPTSNISGAWLVTHDQSNLFIKKVQDFRAFLINNRRLPEHQNSRFGIPELFIRDIG